MTQGKVSCGPMGLVHVQVFVSSRYKGCQSELANIHNNPTFPPGVVSAGYLMIASLDCSIKEIQGGLGRLVE